MSSPYWILPVVLLSACGLSIVLTWMIRETAIASGWAIPPSSERHIHKTAIPRLGGVAIFATFTIVTCVSLVIARLIGPKELPIREFLALMVPATILFIVGVVDDFLSIGPFAKIVFQVVAGLSLSALGLKFIELHVQSPGLAKFVAISSTVAWVMGITNAVNIIDGVDGLAGGSTLFSVLAIAIIAIIAGNHFVAFLAVALAGTLLGFLRFNFHPATIFLGDCGSLFLGFVLSALALMCKRANVSPAVALAVPSIVLGFPIAEMAVSIVRRFLSGKGILKADREHIHHRLLALGLTQRQVVGVLYGFTAVCCLIGVLLFYSEPAVGLILLALVAIFVIASLHRLEYPEFHEFRDIFRRMFEHRRVIANNVLLRVSSKRLQSCVYLEDIYEELGDTFGSIGVYEFELALGFNKRGASLHKSTGCEPVAGRAWCLEFDLRDEAYGLVGYLRMNGATKQAQFDINLLLVEFSRSLAAAILKVEPQQTTNVRKATVHCIDGSDVLARMAAGALGMQAVATANDETSASLV
jgi:UDP-GlcNAc:undecaprenyl-phosphate/decaprenyl-phosphate GlcNAc-1-phosphate transferase